MFLPFYQRTSNLGDNQVFNDVPYSAGVSRLVKAGLFSGYGNGSFGSNDYLTNEQMKAVLKG